MTISCLFFLENKEIANWSWLVLGIWEKILNWQRSLEQAGKGEPWIKRLQIRFKGQASLHIIAERIISNIGTLHNTSRSMEQPLKKLLLLLGRQLPWTQAMKRQADYVLCGKTEKKVVPSPPPLPPPPIFALSTNNFPSFLFQPFFSPSFSS